MTDPHDDIDADAIDEIDPDDPAAIARATLRAASGPVVPGEVVGNLIEIGFAARDATAAVAELEDDDGVCLLEDGRLVDAWVALDGSHVAHRMTADELRHGVLVPGTDLAVLGLLLDPDEGELFLGEGVHLQEVHPAFDADLLQLYEIPVDAVPNDGAWLLVGADLAAASEGDLVTIQIERGQALLVGPTPTSDADRSPHVDEAVDRAVGAAVLDAWRALAQADDDTPDPDLPPSPELAPVLADELLIEAVVRDPRVLGPGSTPPTETLARHGWVTEEAYVGAAGTDFSILRLSLEVAELAAFYRLDEQRAVSLGFLLRSFEAVKAAMGDDAPDERPTLPDTDDVSAYRRRPPGPIPEPDADIDLGADAAALVSWLGDPDVAAAFVSQAIGIRADHAPALFQFAAAARRVGPRSIEAAACWLEAKALTRLGHPLAAADLIDEAVRLDRDLVPLLLDAANLASDRGDAATAIRYARAAGLDDRDDFVRTLDALVPVAPPGLGRNDPCFCGSGRKYKQCHLNRQTLDLEQRAGWLYRKAMEWIQDTAWRLRLVEIATAYTPDEDDPDEVLLLAMSQPFVVDLALSDDDAWSDFLADRGPLLPADERSLAERWGAVRRSVHEVVRTEPGEAVVVRDLRGGPDVPDQRVTEQTFSIQARPGDVILARVLPVGDGLQFFGGIISLGPSEHDELIEVLDAGGSGLAIATLLGSMRESPRLSNTEGEPLVFCGATFRVPDPDVARATLDADPELRPDRTRPTDGADEDIEPFDASWVAEVTIDGRDWIRSRWTLRGDELVLEANSEVRMARAQEHLASTIAGAELVHTEQRPLDELASTAPFDPRALVGQGGGVTSELQAVLDQIAGTTEGDGPSPSSSS